MSKPPHHRLALGFARLLGADVEAFHRPGITLVTTEMRRRPTWAEWIQHVKLVRIGESVVVSAAQENAGVARKLVDREPPITESLMDPKLLQDAIAFSGSTRWLQRDVFFYPEHEPPAPPTDHTVEALTPDHPDAAQHLGRFDAATWVIVRDGRIAALAGVKDKGVLHEIAVETHPAFRRRGLGRTVVAHAVSRILQRDRLPIYVPDSPENRPSYRLCKALDFVKGAELMAWEDEVDDWSGFDDRRGRAADAPANDTSPTIGTELSSPDGSQET